MSDKNSSDLLPEDEKKPEEEDLIDLDEKLLFTTQGNDDDIIELSEDGMLSEDDDDDIIELTEESSPVTEEEEDIFDLSDDVSAEEESDAFELTEEAPDQEDNAVLDLVEESPLAESQELSLDASEEEAPLNLSEEVNTEEASGEDEDILELSEEPNPAGEDTNLSIDTDDIIDEGDVSDAADDTPLPDDLELGEALDDAIENEPIPQDSLADDMGIVLGSAKGLSLAPEAVEQPADNTMEAPIPIDISPDQIEAALERIIEKKLSDKMDGLLMQAIENSVAKEIDRIKRLLLDEVSEN